MRNGETSVEDAGTPDVIVERTVEAYLRAMRDRDAERWLATFALDAVVYLPVGTPPIEGRRSLRAVIEPFLASFSHLHVEESLVMASGTGVAVDWVATGESIAGQAVEFEGVDVFEFGPLGKIETLWAYWSPDLVRVSLQS